MKATTMALRGAAMRPASMGAAVTNKTFKTFCRSDWKHYLCSDFHTIQAAVSPTAHAVGLFCASGSSDNIGSVPCGALMRPLPVSGGSQRGAEPFYVLAHGFNIMFHF